ncbi:hypothetical protein ACHAXS_000528 [Conticribra weissflogii]
MNKPALEFYQDFLEGRGLQALISRLVCGVPYATFIDYFTILLKFGMKFVPDNIGLNNIKKLHCNVHGVNGMLGSLDCSLTKCKIKEFPIAWAVLYQVVLEGITDYHMFFRHASCDFAGTLKNKTIFDMSPFQECLLDDLFKRESINMGPIKNSTKCLFMWMASIYFMIDL